MRTLLSSMVVALLAALLPEAALGAISRTLVLAIALMAAGIFPCMTLAVNAMKGEGRSPSMVQDLYDQLRTLLKVLVVAFVLAVLAVLSLVGTSAAIEAEAGFWPVKVGAVLAGSALGLFIGRVVAIGKAFFALLEINKKQALLIARDRVRKSRDIDLETSQQEKFPSDRSGVRKFRKVS